ncbi:hypothetical protein QZN30_06570 [Burkholderia multivorans]|nr:hypothetical protein [Burkholderia multivorans]
MNILSKLPGFRRFNEELTPTCPGGWIAQDPRTGQLTANLMLRLDSVTLGPESFGRLPRMLGPGIEVRAGVLARRAYARDLDGWVEAQETHALEQVARENAEHLAREGLRTVRQYLWLVAALPASASLEAMRARLGELEDRAQTIAAELPRVPMGYSPADEGRDVAKTYEPRNDPTGGIPPTACSFFPVYPDWTGYLQGERSSDNMREVLPELLHQTHTSFTIWVTAEWLSHDASRRVRRAAEAGFLRCKYQLTLHHCDKGRRHHAHAAMRRHGLVFSEESDGILGWRAAKKTFWKHMDELASCSPLLEFRDNPVDHAGLLLRTDAGTPVVFDPFRSETNHNVLVTGGQAAGKEYLCRSLLSAHVAAGGPAWLVAGENSAASTTALVDMLGGRSQVLTLDGTGLNPLAMCQEEADVFELRNWVASLITPVVSDLNWDCLMRLERAMVTAWQYRKGAFRLEHVRLELMREDDTLCRELADALAPYTGDGEYVRLFSGEPLDLDTDTLLVLDTTAFSGEKGPMLTMTLLAMLNLHWKNMPCKPRKMVYFDAGNGLSRYDYQVTGAAGLLQTILRRSRIFNGAFVTCLPYEDLVDWRRRPAVEVVVENSAWHALMQVPRYAADREDLTKALGYPEQVSRLWPHARTIPHKGAWFVLTSWAGTQLLSLNPGQLHQGMHATNDLRGPAYRAARAQGLTPVDALRAATTPGAAGSE